MGSYTAPRLTLKRTKVFKCEHCNTLIAACRLKDIKMRTMQNKVNKLSKTRHKQNKKIEELKSELHTVKGRVRRLEGFA